MMMVSSDNDAQLLIDAGFTSKQIAKMDVEEWKATIKRLRAPGPSRKPRKRFAAGKAKYVDFENQEQFQIWLREAPAGDKKAYFYDEQSLASYRVRASRRLALLQRREDSSDAAHPRPATEDQEIIRIQMTLALCRQVYAAGREWKIVEITQQRAPNGKGWVYYVTKKHRPGVTYADSRR